MSWGVLVYGYAAKAEDIVNMPRVERTSYGALIENDMSPLEWAAGHRKYGDFVHCEDESGYLSDKVIFGVIIGESGDSFTFEEMDNAKSQSREIAGVVRFFCDTDVSIDDFKYHLITIYE